MGEVLWDVVRSEKRCQYLYIQQTVALQLVHFFVFLSQERRQGRPAETVFIVRSGVIVDIRNRDPSRESIDCGWKSFLRSAVNDSLKIR